ncbi:PsiF family protein [Hyphomicrobium facile]|uniref:PsiF repeat-containing protein n=1 Tax=Hyphomicrobium facile TaxID=51670 RepID=A0A1I7MZ23_9HYPH|nr:PsiF family protein [Hyphomicrobium facile]SFV27669.1 psiF repeat-containing protein [Hyphomicrobium facile]
MITTRLIAAAVAATFVMGSGAAFAAATDKSAASMECSKQADAKGLHGKERKKFREHCKQEMMHSKDMMKPEEKKY